MCLHQYDNKCSLSKIILEIRIIQSYKFNLLITATPITSHNFNIGIKIKKILRSKIEICNITPHPLLLKHRHPKIQHISTYKIDMKRIGLLGFISGTPRKHSRTKMFIITLYVHNSGVAAIQLDTLKIFQWWPACYPDIPFSAASGMW